MMLVAIMKTLRTATLIVFTLSSGAQTQMFTDDATCFLAQVMFHERALFVSDIDVPIQRPVDVECKCAIVEEFSPERIAP